VEEVLGVRARRIRRDDRQAAAQSMVGGDERRHLPRETDRLAPVGRRVHVAGVRIGDAESGHHRPERIHGGESGHELRKELDDLRREPALGGERAAHFVELLAPGEASLPEKEAHLFEGGVVCQVVDVDPAVGEDSAFAVDEADRRIGGDDVLEPRLEPLHFGHPRARHAPIVKYAP
jgi:hypothetical protein